MDPKETHQQQQQNRNNNAAALTYPTSTSQAVQHNRSTVGALSPRQTQPQQQALMLNASPYSVATQQPGMQLGNAPDGGDSGGDANASTPAKRLIGRPPGSRTKKRRNYWRGNIQRLHLS